MLTFRVFPEVHKPFDVNIESLKGLLYKYDRKEHNHKWWRHITTYYISDK
jgi:hypothetical protein